MFVFGDVAVGYRRQPQLGSYLKLENFCACFNKLLLGTTPLFTTKATVENATISAYSWNKMSKITSQKSLGKKYLHTATHICIYLYISIYLQIYMSVCVCVYIYICIYTHLLG